MKLIFVATPLAAPDAEGVEHNKAFACEVCRQIIDAGGVPFAPHLLYTQMLDDHDPVQRAQGIASGKLILARCDEFWAVLPYWRTEYSTGMRHEVAEAEEIQRTRGTLVVRHCLTGRGLTQALATLPEGW